MERLLIAHLEELLRDRSATVLIALDGRSGSGKSTLAATVAARIGAAVIDGDDFYSGGTAEEWDAMTPAEKAAQCIDWRRQRPALASLARGERASWQSYDWKADDGRLSDDPVVCKPASVVILEGVYSARPELADLEDLRVLVDVPDRVRRERLLRREGEHYRAEWESRWAEAEEYYFSAVMPPEAFDLVLRSGRSPEWSVGR